MASPPIVRGKPPYAIAEIEPKFIQRWTPVDTAWTSARMRSHHLRVRVPAHIKTLDECFEDFLVRATCECGAVREIPPEVRY